MTEYDILRLIQCLNCEHDPNDCGRTESDEDDNGLCMDYVDRRIKERRWKDGTL